MSSASSLSKLIQGWVRVVVCLGLAAPPASADLLLFYDFDDASEPETAFDKSGAGNDGTIGVALYTDPGLGHTGKGADRALDFLTGVDGAYIDVPAAIDGAFESIVANDSATILMWVFGGEFQPQNHFSFWFAEGEGDPRQLSAHIPWSDGTIYFDVNGCCGATQRISRQEPDDTKWKGQWNHYAFVKDQEFTRIYQNGELWLEGSGKGPVLSIHTVRFGSGGGAPGNLSYNGFMDDIGVWDEALDQDQILNVMDNGIIKPPVAKMTVSVTQGEAPLLVAFDATGSTTPEGTIESYAWSFGDGESAAGVKVEHTYAHRGTYKAKLTVKDSRGARGSTTTEITATFACGSVAPAYSSVDVGAPTKAGCARREGDDYVIFGAGKDIRQRADQFQFVYREETGDVTLTAQVKEIILDNKLMGRAGLMLRESTASDAAFACIHTASSLGGLKAAFLSRVGQAFPASLKGSAVVFVPPDAWLRLERKGAELIGYASIDGAGFNEVGRVTLTAPPATLLGGMAVTSADINDKGLTIEARMRPDSGAPPLALFHRGDADDNGQLQLTDAIRILGFLYLGQASPACLDAADADDNGTLQLTDAIRILNYLYTGGIAPESPGPPPAACGADPTPLDAGADLGCTSYASC